MTNPTACQLKPCPFCGSLKGYVERYDYVSCYRQCDNCMARGPIKVIEDEDEEVPGHDPALDAWNTREPEGEAVACRLFDGEGGYHYTDDEETMDRWEKDKDGWGDLLYTHPRATSDDVNDAYTRGRSDGWEAHEAKVSATSAEVEKDAARYRWLANRVLYMDYGDNDMKCEAIGYGVRADLRDGKQFMFGPSIDSAIDAALAKRGESDNA